ncbi:unnamed protein product [Ixodes persulcatus]
MGRPEGSSEAHLWPREAVRRVLWSARLFPRGAPEQVEEGGRQEEDRAERVATSGTPAGIKDPQGRAGTLHTFIITVENPKAHTVIDVNLLRQATV